MSDDAADRTTGTTGPCVLVFDVNETLSDLSPLRDRLEEVGAPGDTLPTWFAAVLRDGFALTAAGEYADFAELARDTLRGMLAERLERAGRGGSSTEAAASAAAHVVAGFSELGVHPDVPDGVRALSDAGHRLVTMTNGSAALTDRLLRRAGLRRYFDALLDVSGPRCWKPAPRAYHHALQQSGAGADRAVLVAVHPWDVAGAQSAGLTGAWLHRTAPATAYPDAMGRPRLSARDLNDLARQLT